MWWKGNNNGFAIFRDVEFSGGSQYVLEVGGVGVGRAGCGVFAVVVLVVLVR